MSFPATWMNLVILSEVSQTERQISYTVYMWNLRKKIQINLHAKQK